MTSKERLRQEIAQAMPHFIAQGKAVQKLDDKTVDLIPVHTSNDPIDRALASIL